MLDEIKAQQKVLVQLHAAGQEERQQEKQRQQAEQQQQTGAVLGLLTELRGAMGEMRAWASTVEARLQRGDAVSQLGSQLSVEETPADARQGGIWGL